jgi:hypothetical protein
VFVTILVPSTNEMRVVVVCVVFCWRDERFWKSLSRLKNENVFETSKLIFGKICEEAGVRR